MGNTILMNKYTPILEITLDENAITGYGRILNEEMMPIQLKKDLNLKTLNKWFMGRQIPEKREGLADVRKRFNSFTKDRNFFSLSDQYWVRHNKNDTWDKLNFFTNRYSPEIGKAFFEPWTVDPAHLMDPSPDRTTNGVLRKRWKQDETGASHLIKAGSVIYHQEPLSEVLASVMLKKLNIIPFVSYELVIDGMRLCSSCRNFVTSDTEFVPAAAIFIQEPRRESVSIYDHLLNMCAKFNIIGAKEFIDNMIVADHIICNNDRHLGNFGFMRSAETGKIIGCAPLFDCGSAYWGTTNTVKQRDSVLFKDKELEILKKAGKRGLLVNAASSKSMIDLIKMYPDIKTEKKTAIIDMIKEMDIELEHLSGTVFNDRDKDKDARARNTGFDMEIEF